MTEKEIQDIISEVTHPKRTPLFRDLPMVSMLIITYGRAAKQPAMLNEAVWWCANQHYVNTEVLIFNDAPGQTLMIDKDRWPNVNIINWPFRIPDLGNKMNIATLCAQGEICCPAEDDDISLRCRAEQAVYRVKGYDCWFPMLWLYADVHQNPAIDGNGVGYTSCAFRRAAMLGNHPYAIKGHDGVAKDWMMANLRVNPETVVRDPKSVTYIYRWGVSQHMSGMADPEKFFAKNDPGLPGTYHIEPKRFIDWEAEVEIAAQEYKLPQ